MHAARSRTARCVGCCLGSSRRLFPKMARFERTARASGALRRPMPLGRPLRFPDVRRRAPSPRFSGGFSSVRIYECSASVSTIGAAQVGSQTPATRARETRSARLRRSLPGIQCQICPRVAIGVPPGEATLQVQRRPTPKSRRAVGFLTGQLAGGSSTITRTSSAGVKPKAPSRSSRSYCSPSNSTSVRFPKRSTTAVACASPEAVSTSSSSRW